MFAIIILCLIASSPFLKIASLVVCCGVERCSVLVIPTVNAIKWSLSECLECH